MPFLSSEQRKRAIMQHLNADVHLACFEADLLKKLAEVQELRRCVSNTVIMLRAADEGNIDVDTVQSVDNAAQDSLLRGIVLYQVVISSGEKLVIRPS